MIISMTLSWKKIGLRFIAIFVLGWGIAYLAFGDRDVPLDAIDQTAIARLGVPPVDPAAIGKIVTDKETGQEFLSNQIIVEFVPGTSEEVALEIIAEHGGKMLQRFIAVPMFLVQIADDGDGEEARAAVRALRRDDRVKNAELNYLTTLGNDS